MMAFAETLPKIRDGVARDLARPGLHRDKIRATVVRLLETTFIRVGNAAYARDNGSFGLTTLRSRHADVSGATVRFEFRGKSVKLHSVDVQDHRVARIVKRCQDLPGQELFQYLDADGVRQAVDSADVNAYLKALTGQDFTAKDFRTWAGTVLAALALRRLEAPASRAHAKRNLARAIAEVAAALGNTPTVCRTSYVHPTVLEAYLEEGAGAAPRNGAAAPRPGLTADETSALALLRRRLRRAAETETARAA